MSEKKYPTLLRVCAAINKLSVLVMLICILVGIWAGNENNADMLLRVGATAFVLFLISGMLGHAITNSNENYPV